MVTPTQLAPPEHARARPGPGSRFTEATLFVSSYLFPVVGFPLVTWGWWHVTGDWRFTAFVMGLPLLFGYLMPGIGTNLFNRWRFHGHWRIGNYYVHHGFIYSSKLALVLLIAMRDPLTMDAWDATAVVVLTGATVSFGGWWHDVYAVKTGKIEIYNRQHREGRSAEEIVTSYAPFSFFVLGGTYAAASVWAFDVLVRDGRSDAFPWVFAAGFALLCIIPSVAFLAADGGATLKELIAQRRQNP